MKQNIKQTEDFVYVQASDGTPLMHTSRKGKVRWLLRLKQAKVVCLKPFTTRLQYDSERYVQDMSVGVDLGSKHLGISATTEAVAPHWIGKSGLQIFDFMEYGNIKAFIAGSTSGRPILRNIDWALATDKPSVSAKSVKFVYESGLKSQFFKKLLKFTTDYQ